MKITNPEKVLWPELGIRKIDYIQKLLELSSYLLPYTEKRLLTTIRYPDGVEGKSFFQKNIPEHSPDWIPTREWHHNRYIILGDEAVLTWLGNQTALELHIPFNTYDQESCPSDLVFDLDPSEGQIFEEVAEAALLVYKELNALQIKSYVKTSGASGLQIYIPVGGKYSYQEAREINKFFAAYFSQKYPQKITTERNVGKRGKRLYFDYLQMWQGKTIISPYSPRATEYASVAAPMEWDELEKGIEPKNFNLLNIMERLKAKKDLFSPLLNPREFQDLSFIVDFVSKKKI
ncbi:MAG: Bifunctional non-homologous end joining protein LigD [Candidatus Dichloromethanomonas elyunquensis]|nr:MAG: Bifunctional non-homologous end joining protein LigD [Candidatus Dichloromethanomonas elyunquensis]